MESFKYDNLTVKSESSYLTKIKYLNLRHEIRVAIMPLFFIIHYSFFNFYVIKFIIKEGIQDVVKIIEQVFICVYT